MHIVTQHTSSVGDASASAQPLVQPGILVEDWRAQGGRIELRASDGHRIKLQRAAVRGHCGAAPFAYRKGDIDLIPAGQADSWVEEQPSAAFMVTLSRELVRRAAEEMGHNPMRATIEPRHQLRDLTIQRLVAALATANGESYPGGRLYIESLGLALAAHLLGGYPKLDTRARGLSRVQEQRLREYIEAYLDRDLSLGTLAEVAGLSTSHLKTLFKRSLGVPVHEYVVRRRLERARKLLAESDLSISQVAFDSGFAHPSHLARCMRQRLGITPKALRS